LKPQLIFMACKVLSGWRVSVTLVNMKTLCIYYKRPEWLLSKYTGNITAPPAGHHHCLRFYESNKIGRQGLWPLPTCISFKTT
jgi:hypothetical protein